MGKLLEAGYAISASDRRYFSDFRNYWHQESLQCTNKVEDGKTYTNAQTLGFESTFDTMFMMTYRSILCNSSHVFPWIPTKNILPQIMPTFYACLWIQFNGVSKFTATTQYVLFRLFSSGKRDRESKTCYNLDVNGKMNEMCDIFYILNKSWFIVGSQNADVFTIIIRIHKRAADEMLSKS